MVISNRAQLHIKEIIRNNYRTLNNIMLCPRSRIYKCESTTKYPAKKNLNKKIKSLPHRLHTDHRSTSTDIYDSQHRTIPILLAPFIACYNQHSLRQTDVIFCVNVSYRFDASMASGYQCLQRRWLLPFRSVRRHLLTVEDCSSLGTTHHIK